MTRSRHNAYWIVDSLVLLFEFNLNQQNQQAIVSFA